MGGFLKSSDEAGQRRMLGGPMRKQNHPRDVLRLSETLLLDSEEILVKGWVGH